MTHPKALPDGWRMDIRPIQPDDEPLWLAFMRDMSWATRYKRGARRVHELSDADVKHAMRPQAGKEVAFVAVAARGDERCLAGVARGTYRAQGVCEFMLVVGDPWQGCGVGTRLMEALMAAAEHAGHGHIVGRVLATNGNMLEFVQRLGFTVEDEPGDAKVKRVVRASPAAA